jgi:hypothetical protein
MGLCGLNWSGSGWEEVKISCEVGNKPLGSMKCWETVEWPNSWWPLE